MPWRIDSFDLKEAGGLYSTPMRWTVALLLLAPAACIPTTYRVEVPTPQELPLHPREIVRLADAGVSDAVLLELAARRGVRPLNADDLVALKNSGVGDGTIKTLVESERHDPPVIRTSDLGYFHPAADPYYYDFQYFRSTGYSSYSSTSWGIGW